MALLRNLHTAATMAYGVLAADVGPALAAAPIALPGRDDDEQAALSTASNAGVPLYAGRVLEVNRGGAIPPSIEAALVGEWPGRAIA